LALEQDQGVVSMSRRFDGETLLFKKQDVRREALDLIIHPQNAFRTGHAGNLTRVSGER